jgi:oxygen-independent coproporphyrinogen-3 oxidase
VDDWKFDLETALNLRPSHLSCYGLVYEKGTALWKQWNAGEVRAVDEEVERSMYEFTIDRLGREGLCQYEISNFAKPGQECRHNLVYWANEPYFGVGVGAARFVGGVRSVNTRDLNSYLNRMESNGDPTGPHEELDPESHARETAVLMLRRTESGIDRSDFFHRTGFDLFELCGTSLTKYLRRGMLEDDGKRVRLTPQGVFIADSVMSDLL